MIDTLTIIQIEDNADDALLIQRCLKKAGYDIHVVVVENEQQLRRVLESDVWQIVLSDYAMPEFDGLAALAIIKELRPGLPFILVSGAVGEETAVSVMRAGAKDFIIKDQLARLVPVIERELQEVHLRNQAEEQHLLLEDQLRQAQKMEAIGTMAGGIAHDFNNILTGIIGYSELVLHELEHLPSASLKVRKVLLAGHRAKELVEQILSFSHQKDPGVMEVELAVVVSETLKLLRASIPSTISIVEHIDPDAGMIWGSTTQIHQLIMNLCTNSYHAMAENGGELTVSLARCEKELPATNRQFVSIEVRDCGCGISKEVQERMFEPYFTTKDKGIGTGLGLSQVHGIVKGLDGFVEVESETGKGSKFTVYLPRVTEPKVVSKNFREEDEVPIGSEHILLVDDEEIIVEFTREILEGCGYKITGAINGQEALAKFKAAPDSFDLILTDMTMPLLTGLDLAKICLQMRPQVPIILCTGFNDQMSKDNAMSIGITEYLMKPVLGSDLCKIVRNVLDRDNKSR